MVGFGAIVLGADAVHWHLVGIIGLSWITSPLMAGLLSYILFLSMQRLVFIKADPYFYARRYAPFYLFLIGIAISTASILRGLTHLGYQLDIMDKITITIGTGLGVTFLGLLLISKVSIQADAPRHKRLPRQKKSLPC